MPHSGEFPKPIRFAKDFLGPIDEFDAPPIGDWLGGLKSLSRHAQIEEISGRTRNNYPNAVVELFNHAQTHDCLHKGIPTAAQATKTVDEVTRENENFRPEDMASLSNEAPPTPDGPRWHWANTRSKACPDGSKTEDTIKKIGQTPRNSGK